METESFSPASQLACLLPDQDDLTAGIVAKPDNSGLWYELSCASGLWSMNQWKYLFVAHRVDPENIRYMEALAWASHRKGDRNQAIGLVNKVVATATREEVRLNLIESRMRMEEPSDVTIN